MGPVEFHVSLTGRGDLTARIYRELLAAIQDGRLRPGERLPPSRDLARRLAVSRNTVTAAYERLTAEGFLSGRVGAGTFVCGHAVTGPARRASDGSVPDGNTPNGSGVQAREPWRSMPAPAVPAPVAEYDFRVGTPDLGLFPFESWRRLVARELRTTAIPSTEYGDPAGHAGLREAVARHVGVSRSVRAGAGDVLVTQGAQQALDLTGRILVEPGATVAVEDPGYPPARDLFRALGARVVGVPVDAEGLVVDRIPAVARLVYTTPSHQFPLGVPMSLARRTALLEWADRHDAVVVEDDYDSEFRYGDRALEPLQSLDRCGRVVYVGSFSKTMLPALRLGFLVAPASLRPALRTAKQLTDWHGDPFTQAALARVIDDGLLARHIRRAARTYADRRDRVLAALSAHLDGHLDVVPSAAGLHLSAWLAEGTRLDPDRALAAGVRISPLDRFRLAPGPDGLVVGYGAIPAERIDEGIRRLAASMSLK